MLLSIIIPVFNEENKIGVLLNKLTPQLNKNTELILVNDGSTDSSLSVIKRFERNNITIIEKQNGGVSSARNAGLRQAKGVYISFIDSDDIISDNYIENILNLCQLDVDLVQMNYFNMEKGKYKKTDFITQSGNVEISDIFNLLINNIINAPWNKLFRNSIITNNKIFFNENITIGEDKLFLIEYLNYADAIYFSEDAVYYYKVAENGLTNSHLMQQFETEKIAKEKIEQLAYNRDIYIDSEIFVSSYLDMLFYTVGRLYNNEKQRKLIECYLSSPTIEEILKHNFSNYKYEVKKLLLKTKSYCVIGAIRKIKG